MTLTHERPLPVDWQTLKAYLPVEPDDTGVHRARHVLAVLDAMVRETRAAVDEYMETDRNLIAELLDAVYVGDDPTPHVAALGALGDRPAMERRLEQLHIARGVAFARLGAAERTDEAYLAWQQRCREVTDAWRYAMSGGGDGDGDEQRRFARLVQFAAQH